MDDAVDKIIPEGAELQIAEEFPDGSVRVLLDNDIMQPDCSSFDMNNDEAGDMFAVAGGEVAKVAKKAGKELFSVIKHAVDNAEASKKILQFAKLQHLK